MDVSEMNGCQTLSFIVPHSSIKTFFPPLIPPIRSREVNGKQHEIRTRQQKGFQSNHRLID